MTTMDTAELRDHVMAALSDLRSGKFSAKYDLSPEDEDRFVPDTLPEDASYDDIVPPPNHAEAKDHVFYVFLQAVAQEMAHHTRKLSQLRTSEAAQYLQQLEQHRVEWIELFLLEKTKKKSRLVTCRKRTSPDTVVVIDLTGDSDSCHDRDADESEEDSGASDARKQTLNSVRKRLKTSPSGRGVAVKPDPRHQEESEVMEVDSDDKDKSYRQIFHTRKKMARKSVRMRPPRMSVTARWQSSTPTAARNNPASDDEEEEDRKMPAIPQSSSSHPTMKVERSCARSAPTSPQEDCQVVSAPPTTVKSLAEASANNNTDGDVELVGVANETRLPHMRQHCPTHKFDPTSNNETANQRYCDMCYCFVCDVPVLECSQWYSATSALGTCNHCHASDTNVRASYWKRLRHNRQHGGDNNHHPAPDAAAAPNAAADGVEEEDNQPGNRAFGAGPFAPEDATAAMDPNLTKCRKCGWFNRFCHRNFRKGNTLHPVGYLDWCQKCGRIASEEDFFKVQEKPYVRRPGDVLIGERTIQFRVIAHDPREMDKYKQSWANNEGWEYSEADMREDVFHHRFGERPLTAMILASIPIVKEDKIPKSGSFNMNQGCCYHSHTAEEEDYTHTFCPGRRYSYFWDNLTDDSEKVSADETDAIVLDSRDDLRLLEHLQLCEEDEVASSDALICRDISATWDKATQKGTFKVQLSLRPSHNNRKVSSKSSHLGMLFGSWYNAFPYALSDISGSLKSYDLDTSRESTSDRPIPVPPFTITKDERGKLMKNVQPKMHDAVKKHQKKARKHRDGQSLLSSHKECKFLGGSCPLELGFFNTLIRYFREKLVEDVTSCGHQNNDAWVNHTLASSLHRMMQRASGEMSITPKDYALFSRDRTVSTRVSYLRAKDVPLATANLVKTCKNIVKNTTTIKGIMHHLENLGHLEAPFVEGLTVKLLKFQKQSLQWALERETMEGGLEMLLWPKLPSVDEPNTDVYFNPMICRTRLDKPGIVRGGILAEEMGLGKTIISLGLILCNPAPEWPLSGSHVSVLNTHENREKAKDTMWDQSLYIRTSSQKYQRGSIISRGTLVICKVSLVGQWVEEAREKLENPGLLYQYHGSGRNRDPTILAEKSIVVTSYETLASDKFFHAEKSGSTDYTAPLEKIRFWRIICDESHSLKDANTRNSQAVMDLVADHKWLVSGTPINTTVMDLKNQLKFLGFGHLPEMFNSFSGLLKQGELKKRSRRRQRRNSAGGWDPDKSGLGEFLFLFRAVMMRHAQDMTYRGSGKTLMSLPPKTERIVEVDFEEDEIEEYKKIENASLEFYTDFKLKHHKSLSSHCLKLEARLAPMRIACAGGFVPEGTIDEDVLEDDDDDDDDPEGEDEKKKRKKTTLIYSEFSFTSKVKKLLEELKSARDNDPTSKSLIFSQFSSTLAFLKEELPKHGFQYRTLSGDMTMKKRAKALHDFQYDPPTTVFLLSMRAGAVGINLTQANRVFLLAPSFNPAVEKQAIGRVHRLGQKRQVEVVRLVIANSVETRLLQLLDKKYGEKTDGDADADASDKDKVDNNDMALVGNVCTDKAQMVAEEFDFLYKFEEHAVVLTAPDAVVSGTGAAEEYDDEAEPAPDVVGSGSGFATPSEGDGNAGFALARDVDDTDSVPWPAPRGML